MAVPSIKEDKSGCGSRLQQWRRSRNCQLWRLLLLPFIPILALIVQTTLSLENSITNGRDVADVEEQVSRATELGKLVTRLQQERSEVAFFIFTNGSTLRSNLTQRFAGTDSAIHQMGDLPFLVFKSRVDLVSGIQFLTELSELSGFSEQQQQSKQQAVWCPPDGKLVISATLMPFHATLKDIRSLLACSTI